MDYSTQDWTVYLFIRDLGFLFRNFYRCLWIWGYIVTLEHSEAIKNHVVKNLSNEIGLSRRWTEEYINRMTKNDFNMIFQILVDNSIRLVPSISLPILFNLWDENRAIFEKLSSKTTFYALFILWQTIAYPEHTIGDLRKAATSGRIGPGCFVSRATFQRSLKLLQILNLIRKPTLRGPIIPNERGKRIIRSIILALSTMFCEHLRILSDAIGWD